MHQEAELIRRSLKTPRAAAIAGIIFSLLLITSQVLIRLSIPSDPLASPLEVRPGQTGGYAEFGHSRWVDSP
jgi:hypothetical protein